jgi:copper chaperone
LIVAIIARIIRRNGLNKRVVLFRTVALGAASFKTFSINNNPKLRFNPMQLKLKVLEMSCGGCLSTIAEAIKTVDANAIVQGDPQTKIVLVETEFPETVIKTAIAQAGYPAS